MIANTQIPLFVEPIMYLPASVISWLETLTDDFASNDPTDVDVLELFTILSTLSSVPDDLAITVIVHLPVVYISKHLDVPIDADPPREIPWVNE